ncbi:hypothetical protein [Planctomicrobium sp. SH664]|uniref:hypothetical protein n=1 Tax=Planctomicrobium sp. SH664 TaxID=3448125 RepID=UPI003F5B4BB9
MFRTAFTLGGVLFELVSYASGAEVAGSAAVAGGIVTFLHVVITSQFFTATVDRIAGCSLPEVTRG